MDALTHKDALRRLYVLIPGSTAGRRTPLRIGVVLPIVVERGLVVVQVQVRDVLRVVPRPDLITDSLLNTTKERTLLLTGVYIFHLLNFIRRHPLECGTRTRSR